MIKINNQSKSKTQYLIPLAIVIAGLIIGGVILYTKTPQQSQELEIAQVVTPEKQEKSTKAEFTITENEHIQGNPEALVTIVEFSDFQCPFCQKFHPTVQQILDNYPNQVSWVYKHFPIDVIHSEATPSAEASECVFEQKGNKGFWQFADGLFKNQSRLGEGLYEELASELSLNMSQFENCFSSEKYKDHVKSDYQEGIRVGVRGTPASFINGVFVSGAVSYERLKAEVEKALSNL